MSDYTVLVGVSDTSNSPVALRWAVMQAERFDGRVVAVRAWKLPPPTASRRPTASSLAHDPEAVRGEARQRLEEDVAAVLGLEHGVEIRLVEGGRRKVLTAQSGDADLLVVGAPRSSDLSGQTLFAHSLLVRARCPVVVMPCTLTQEPPSALSRGLRSLATGVLYAAGTAGRPGRPPINP